MGNAGRLHPGAGCAVLALLLAACGSGAGGVDPAGGDHADVAGWDIGDPGDTGLDDAGPPGDDLPDLPDGWALDAGDGGVDGIGDPGNGADAADGGDVADGGGLPGDAWGGCPDAALDLGWGACGVPEPVPVTPPASCQADGQCDDHHPCTRDKCYQGKCWNTWEDTACCPNDAWCDAHPSDRDACTTETCRWLGCAGTYGCVAATDPACTREVPWVQDFARMATPADGGWTVVDTGADAACHWRLEAGTPAGLGADAHVVFQPAPVTPLVKSLLASPRLDASGCPVSDVTTVQWRLLYRHADPGAFVTLKVVAFGGADPAGASVLWTARTNADLAYDLHSAELPNALKHSPDLHLGFLVDTEDGGTAALGRLEVDDLRIGCGKPNVHVRSKTYRCQDGDATCNFNTMKVVAQAEAAEPMALEAQPCARYRVILCQHDPDARYFTWQYFGFPAVGLDALPLDDPGILVTAPDVGQGGGCETAGFAVGTLCGVPTADPGYFFCAMTLDVPCDAEAGRAWDVGLVVDDERNATLPLNSPFQSLTRFRLEIASPPPADPGPEPLPDAGPDA